MSPRPAGPAPLASPRRADPAARTPRPYVLGVAALGALALAAFVNDRLAKKAERDHPPLGRFLDLGGVRLHVLERGAGAPVVLLHGNGSMIEDFVSSGIVDALARDHRVIALDRPGFGHSTRPRTTVWTAEAQADLIGEALTAMGVTGAVVLGHSWGCAVAVALARRRPDLVGALVLASGYHYPTARTDVVGAALPALPVLGDVMRFTLSPLLARALWPLALRTMFGPAPVPAAFGAFPKEMTFRPSQIRASAAEAALMVPGAAAAGSYADLGMPVAIVAGAQDRLIDPDAQSARLHGELAQSSFDRVAGAGHMVHQTAPDAIVAAIERASRGSAEAGPPIPLAA